MLTFKTEEDKQAALDAIVVDPPPNVKVDEFQKEAEGKIDEIMKAEIVPDGDLGTEGPEKKVESTPDPSAHVSDPEKEISKKTEIPDEKDTQIEQLTRNNQYLQDQMSTSSRENQSKYEQLEAKIESLKKAAENPDPENLSDKPKTEVDHQLIAIQDQITKVQDEMNGIDEDDADPLQVMKLTQKSNQLTTKLISLNNQKQSDLIKKQAGQIKDLETTQRLEREKDANDAKENLKNEAIQKFSDSIPELKTKKTYAELDLEYGTFSSEVAAIYYNIRPADVKHEHAEVAMQSYLKGSPILNETLNKRGISEPEELRKFVLLSEINALKQGYILDQLTGKFVAFKDSVGSIVNFPTHNAAYLYLKNERGDAGQDLLNVQNKTASGLMQAITRRSDPIELGQEHQKQQNLEEITKERADEIIKKFTTDEIMIRARKDFNDPLVTEYNKALKKLGYAQLEHGDVS